MGVDLQSINTVMNIVEDLSLPITGFEGVEKRLEVAFSPMINSNHDGLGGLSYHEIKNKEISDSNLDGLRRLSHNEINNLLKLAECTIVAELHNHVFDSYVLSESSLFVYPHRIILKTCGRTQLLKCISLLLKYACSLSLEPCFCKYTHGTFIFPLNQPFPYTCFEEEVKYLDTFFGHIMESQAYTMGTQGYPNWHIYLAATHNYSTFLTLNEPLYTLEMGMTQLDTEFTSNFFNASGSKSGNEMTTDSRIDKILPNSSICDFAFAPCGYSMNGMDGGAFSTIHITPEESHSYGSFEAMGYNSQSIYLQELVDCVVSIFKPGRLVMSMHVSRSCSVQGTWGSSVMPSGYVCDSTQREELPGNSVVTFHTFVLRNNQMKSQEVMQLIPKPLFPCCGDAAKGGMQESNPWRECVLHSYECVLGDNVCECIEWLSVESKEIECTGREGMGIASSCYI